MKKKIFLVILAFFVAGFISFGTLIGIRINNEAKKYNTYKTAMAEFQKMVENISEENLDEFKELVGNIKSEGDYARVEKAVKEYIRDTVVPFYETAKVQANSIYTQGVSSDFLTKNMPEFKNAYETLDKMTEQLNQLQTVTDTLFTREAAMKYLGDGLDEEYVDLFEEEVKDIYEDPELAKSYTDYINKIRPITAQYRKILDFLVANTGKWSLDGETIVFKTTVLTNQFNALAEELGLLGEN